MACCHLPSISAAQDSLVTSRNVSFGISLSNLSYFEGEIRADETYAYKLMPKGMDYSISGNVKYNLKSCLDVIGGIEISTMQFDANLVCPSCDPTAFSLPTKEKKSYSLIAIPVSLRSTIHKGPSIIFLEGGVSLRTIGNLTRFNYLANQKKEFIVFPSIGLGFSGEIGNTHEVECLVKYQKAIGSFGSDLQFNISYLSFSVGFYY